MDTGKYHAVRLRGRDIWKRVDGDSKSKGLSCSISFITRPSNARCTVSHCTFLAHCSLHRGCSLVRIFQRALVMALEWPGPHRPDSPSQEDPQLRLTRAASSKALDDS